MKDMTMMENAVMNMTGCTDRTTANLVANAILNIEKDSEGEKESILLPQKTISEVISLILCLSLRNLVLIILTGIQTKENVGLRLHSVIISLILLLQNKIREKFNKSFVW